MLQRKRRSTGRLSKNAVWKRDNYTCQYCGYNIWDMTESRQLTVDHIIPVRHNGIGKMKNLVTACFPCNAFFHDKWFPSLEEKKRYIKENLLEKQFKRTYRNLLKLPSNYNLTDSGVL